MSDTYECEKCGRFYSEEIICPYCLDTMTRSAEAKDHIKQQAERINKLERTLYDIAYKMAGSSKSKKMAKEALKG